jgi:hypothetical protein
MSAPKRERTLQADTKTPLTSQVLKKARVSGKQRTLVEDLSKSKTAPAYQVSLIEFAEDVVGTTPGACSSDSDEESTVNLRVGQRKRRMLEGKAITLSGALTHIEASAIEKKTRVQYMKVVDAFLAFVAAWRLPMISDADVDQSLVQHFQSSYALGRMAHEGEKLLCAIMHFLPEFGRFGAKKLPRTHRALRGWRKLTPGRTRTALPFQVWCAVALMMIRLGQRSMALFTLMSLSGYLRPHEGLSLSKGSLIAPLGNVTRFWSLLLHPESEGIASKTGLFNESLLLDSDRLQFINPLLSQLAQGSPTSRLWDFDYGQLLRTFKKVQELLGLMELVPYMLRHSGVTHDVLNRLRTLEEAQKRGRWQSRKSMNRYEKHARMAGTMSQFSREKRLYFDMCEKQLEDVILGRRAPPAPAPA